MISFHQTPMSALMAQPTASRHAPTHKGHFSATVPLLQLFQNSLLPNAKLCHVTAIRFTTFIFRICIKTCQKRNKGMSTPEMNSSYLFLPSPYSDINECDSNNGGCDHRCVNEPGSFRCECRTGFDLASNGTTCIGKL